MNLNRRSFIQAAALLPAVASQTLGRTQLSPLPAAAVDLADVRITDREIRTAAEVYVRLFELNGDEGQFSGARLIISDHGEDAALLVVMGEHFLGWAGGLMRFLEVAEDRGELGLESGLSLLEHFPDEPYPCSHNLGYVTLIPGTDPELRVTFGLHCFGFLKGPLAAKFLACVRHRCEAEA